MFGVSSKDANTGLKLKKVPKFILIVDPHDAVDIHEISALKTIFPVSALKKLSKEGDDETYFPDRSCGKDCVCEIPDMILLINSVFRLRTGCFMVLNKAEILFTRKYTRAFFKRSLVHFSECEIRNGL